MRRTCPRSWSAHAHYDHLMDVPYVARRHAPTATVYGNETTRNILAAGGVPWHRRVSLNDRAGDSENGGEWVTVAGGRIRFMALRSDHAPHFRGIELYEGFYRSRQPDLPVFAWDWVGGETLAYLIDFLDENGQVEFRIHYADATSSPPDGHVAPAVLAETPGRPGSAVPTELQLRDGLPGGHSGEPPAPLRDARPLGGLLPPPGPSLRRWSAFSTCRSSSGE